MALVNKKITADELAQRLVGSRKVMQKVNTDDYQKGNINEELLISNEANEFSDEIPVNEEKQVGTPLRSVNVTDPQRINQSKLPDNIKKAMLEHPIPQITLNDNLDMNVVSKARKLMERDGTITKKPNIEKQGQAPRPIPNKTSLTTSNLESIIEGVVRKVLDEKLTQILTAQQVGTLNENLAIKVGDSIFTGKITKVKSSK